MKKLLLVLMIGMMGVKGYGQSSSWEWARDVKVAGNINSEFESMAVDFNGNVYFIGTFKDTITFGSYNLINPDTITSYGNFFLAKYDSLGNFLWARTSIGTSTIFTSGVTTDFSGNVFVTGGFRSPKVIFDTDTLINSDTNAGTFDFFLIKYDSSGNLIWATSGGGDNEDFGMCLSTDINGNILVGGAFSSPVSIFESDTIYTNDSSNDDIFLVKYDQQGNLIYAKAFGGSYADYVYSIGNDDLGNFYLTGSYRSPTISFDSFTLTNFDSTVYSTNIFVVKFDSLGNVIYAKTIGGSIKDEAYFCKVDLLNNLYVTGYFRSSSIAFDTIILTNSGNDDGFLVKYNSNGNVIYAKSFGGSGSDYGYNLSIDISNNVYLSGGFTSSSIMLNSDTLQFPVGGSDPMFIAKFDSIGNILYSKVLQSGGDDLNFIAFYGSNKLYVGGDFYGVNPFIFGNDSLFHTGGETPFIAKLNFNLTVGFTQISPKQSITLYPNPTSGTFTISYNQSGNSNNELGIYDVLGQEVYHQAIINQESTVINLPKISNGVYFYQLTNSKETWRGKFVVEM